MWPMFRANRGFTLLELLVSMTLLTLGLTVLVWAVAPSLKLSSKGARRAELQQTATFVTRRLAKEITATVPTGIGIASSPGSTLFSTHPISGLTPDGEQIWKSELRVFRWQESTGYLEVTTWTAAESAVVIPEVNLRPQMLEEGQLLAISTEATLGHRRLGGSISEFSLNWSDPATPVLPLRMQMTLGEGEDTLRVERRFHLFNSL